MLRKILIFFIIIFSSIQIYYFSQFFVDDSYISYRYAKNLASGKGLVFNEGERVEGFTNFSFTILISIAEILKINPLHFARIISIISLILIYFFLYKFSSFFLNGKIEKLIPVLFLSLSSSFFYWTMAGLETILFSFSILFLSFLELKNNSSFLYNFAHILTITTRPEGFVVSGLVLLFRFLKVWKNIFKIIYPFLIFLIFYLGFKFFYYGSIFPNTFYAKVLGPKILYQTIDFFKENPHFLIFFLSIFYIIRKNLFLPFLITLFFLIHPFIFGGDIMPFYRFFVHILPFLCLFSFLSLNLFQKRFFIKYILLIIFLLSSIYFSLFSPEKINAILAKRIAEAGIFTGKFLKENVNEKSLIAVNAIGTIGYFSELPLIDMLGLCDKNIGKRKVSSRIKSIAITAGHGKGDGLYVLKKKPEVILFGNSGGSENPVYLSDFEMINEKDFRDNYILKKIVIFCEEKKGKFYFPPLFKKHYKKFYYLKEIPVESMYYGRFDIGFDIFINLKKFPAEGIFYFYPFEFKFFVRKDSPLLKLKDDEMILPPLLYPENYYNALNFLDAGLWFASKGEYEKAEKYFKKSLELKKNFYIHFLLGRLYFLLGKKEEAKINLNEALKLRPDMEEAKELLKNL